MVRVALGQLWHRAGRTLALLLAVAVATGSFVLLTGSVETARLQVRGTVEQNFRSSYDLLVRPASSYTDRERAQGLVRPNYQSGIFGGISTDQVGAVRDVPGVEVAAPVSNIGYVHFGGAVTVPLKPHLSSDAQQLFRIRPTWTMDRGTSRFVGTPIYVYVSRNKTVVLNRIPYTRGEGQYREFPSYAEVVPQRRKPVPVCTNYEVDKTATLAESGRSDTPFGYRDPYATTSPPFFCYYTRLNPSASSVDALGAGNPAYLDTVIPVSFPVLLAAVDPTAEAQLSGLDRAVVSGRGLTATDQANKGSDGNPVIPVLAASSTDVDQQVSATIDRVSPPRGGMLSDAFTGEKGVLARVAALPSTRIAQLAPVPASDSYTEALSHATGKEYGIALPTYWTVDSSTYTQIDPRTLAIRPVVNPETVYGSPQSGEAAPVGSDDAAVRKVEGYPLQRDTPDYPGVSVVGLFDPDKVVGDSRLSGVTSATYVTPLLPGADPASQRALGEQPLAPSTNLGGYPAQPPTLLTTLAGAAPLLDATRYQGSTPAAPISVVRVRVSGIRGTDPVSRERLNQVALAISQRTGLAVDIVAGASGVPTTVVLPAGRHGRPQLALLEDWARKGVAYQVVDAVDRKSLALFVLVLTVCALVVGNAASAAVRTRRTELGVLSCLGWGAGRLFAAVQLELALVGLAAGVLGSGLALGAARLFDLAVPATRAGWAVPAAVLLTALAGLAPALRASSTAPMQAVLPQVVPPRGNGTVRTVRGLAGLNLRRVPGRTLLAAASLAIGVAAATFLVSVQELFRGVVVGSLLGDAVTVQVRAPDLLALAAIVLLGAAGVADVLYLTAREQAGELAVLRATGWTDSALSRLVVHQGTGIGILGAFAGAVAGAIAIASFAQALPLGLILVAAACAAAGLLVAVGASLVPALLIRQLPVSVLLAEEI